MSAIVVCRSDRLRHDKWAADRNYARRVWILNFDAEVLYIKWNNGTQRVSQSRASARRDYKTYARTLFALQIKNCDYIISVLYSEVRVRTHSGTEGGRSSSFIAQKRRSFSARSLREKERLKIPNSRGSTRSLNTVGLENPLVEKLSSSRKGRGLPCDISLVWAIICRR